MAMREGNLPQALATLDQALSVFPDGEHLLYLRADCLYELDRYSEAENTLARIIAGPGQQQYRGGVPGEIKTKLAPGSWPTSCV